MKNEFLRHLLSAIEYRFNKSISLSTEQFANYCAGNGSRSPKEIIHHMFQVLKNTRTIIGEEKISKESFSMLDWSVEIERFRKEIKSIDSILAIKELDINFSKKLIQGPLSDILTHIGQIAMLSRLNGNLISGEDFSVADIFTGIE